MARLVAFLRGVNVGGINIKMADLTQLFAGLGYTDVRTVLASGNVLFDTKERDRAATKRRIEAALTERFGYEAWVILLDLPALAKVIEGYPFDEDNDEKQPWAMLLAEPGVLDDLLSVAGALDPAVERVQPGEGVLYWEVTKGSTVGSVFGKHSAKPRFKALTTTRNLRTLRKLLE
ncbi:MAG: pyridoxamine 5-phosphate oxidase [Chloroflexi bacterium HGW-Chloroflexi-9]|nr:MAG: pyridoxamine 5-phosphate oxidase [Chloroflexi bacterium HGW-Chloroflexi-9]